MTIAPSIRGHLAVVAGLCLAVGGFTVFMQAAGQDPVASPAPLTCDGVLSAAAAQGVVGDEFVGPAVDEPRPGFTRCDWQGPAEANFGFTFASAQSLTDDGATAPAQFEMEVSAVESDTRTRETLTGIGTHAALVALSDAAVLVVVARADGVARFTAYKVARPQVIALVRAIGTP